MPANNPMHPSGEVGRFQMDNLSSPPGDWCRSTKGNMIWKRHMIAGFLVRLDFLVSWVSWDSWGPTVINIWPDSLGLHVCRWPHSWSCSLGTSREWVSRTD